MDDFESQHFLGDSGERTLKEMRAVSRFVCLSTDPIALQIIEDLQAGRCSIVEAILGAFHAHIPLSQIRPLIGLLSGQSRRIDFLDECIGRIVERIRRWDARELTAPHRYLIFGSVQLRVRLRAPIEVHRFHVGFAWDSCGSVEEVGTWPVLGVEPWAEFLGSIKARGRLAPRLVVVPPDEAALSAAAAAFPRAHLQVSIPDLIRALSKYVRPEHLPESIGRCRVLYGSVDPKVARAAGEQLIADVSRVAYVGEAAELARCVQLSMSYLGQPAEDRHLIRQNPMPGVAAAALLKHTCKIAAGVSADTAELMVLARLRWLMSTKWMSRTRVARERARDIHSMHVVRSRRSA